MILYRSFARAMRHRQDFKSKLKYVAKDVNQQADEHDDSSMDVVLSDDHKVSIQSIKLTQMEKVKQLSKMVDINDVDDADTQAKRRYYIQQKKFSQDLIEKDEDYDDMNKKLVQRPKKETLWGLGGELLRRKENFFEFDRIPTPEEIQFYLELELMKDITITNLKELGKTDVKWGVCATGYSSSHIYRTAKNLVTSLNLLRVEWRNKPQVHGRKDDDWLEVSIASDISVLLFVPEARESQAIEFKWMNWNDEQVMEEYRKMILLKKRKTIRKPFVNP